MRGRRVFCSNRGRRKGCGLTFPIFLANILPRHSVTAAIFWQLLLGLLAGSSLKSVAQGLRLPFALETLYGVTRRLRRRLDVVRTFLCREQMPPQSAHSDALLQTVEHFAALFAGSAIQEFQLHFQRPLMG